jgi:putative lysine transport system substrate-binding protein
MVKKMKRRILAFALALTCMVSMLMTLTACGKIDATKDLETVQKDGVLKVGMECNYAPFNWTQTASSDTAVALSAGGYGDGYDVQIALKLADALGVKLEIVKLKWEGLIPALESGKVDCIIAGMSPTAERKESIDFSDPYYKSELVVVVEGAGKYAGATTLADFSGAKITGQLDTCNYTVIDQIPEVQKQTALSDFPSMIAALQGAKSTVMSVSFPLRNPQ